MKTTLNRISLSVSRKARSLLLSMLIIGLTSFISNQDTLILKIENVKKNGTLYVSFCSSPDEWSDQGSFTFEFPAAPSRNNTYKIDNIPIGSYAVALFQDLNGNGVLDTNLLGIPKEPYAFSNDVKPVLSAPSYEKCQFQFQNDLQTLSIHLLN